jgi:phenylacetate-CoA ligase
MDEALQKRFPLITEAGAQRLRWLTEHPHAPRYTHPGCDKLDAAALARVRAFDQEIQSARRGWRPGQVPDWIDAFAEACYRGVPFYRRHGARPASFFDIAPATRADLSREPWAFVPDSQALDGLLVYNTSGTTGHPLSVLSHPESAAKYLPLLQAALASRGIVLPSGSERMAAVLVCFQQRTFTYASVSMFLDQAGFAKINLYPDDWRDPDDRAKFLDACDPAVYTGDPLSFAELARLPLTTKPRALVSTSMALSPGWRAALETRFACPVIDVYSMNESGPVAVADPVEPTYHLLQPQLYVEVLDADDAPCSPGEVGEVTLSGGFNPFLPLLRYRTGDYAVLEFTGPGPVLASLQGRAPVTFWADSGRAVNNADVSSALRRLPLAQFALHQAADGALTLRVQGSWVGEDDLRAALRAVFGRDQRVNILLDTPPLDSGGRLVQYTSDLEPTT